MPTGGLIRSLWCAGVDVYLPVIRPGSRCLKFRQFAPGTALRPNRYGVPEPYPAAAPAALRRQLDVVFLPLVGFDAAGRRLGMGGGYYDATFADRKGRRWQPPRLIGLAFTVQQAPRVPGASWDLPLEGVITERGYAKLPVRDASQEQA